MSHKSKSLTSTLADGTQFPAGIDWNRLTPENLKALYPLLSQPFPEECYERTSGKETGKGYDTSGVGYQHVVNRLNEVLGPGHWQTEHAMDLFEARKTTNNRTMFGAEAKLTLLFGNWVGPDFEPIARYEGYGEHESLRRGDAKKGAYTNGFKKAAGMAGVGREAYEGAIDDDNKPAAPPEFPSGEFAVKVIDGAVEKKTARSGSEYTVFEGTAALVTTGESFTIKAFGALADKIKAAVGREVAIAGQWNERFGSFDVKELHLAPAATPAPNGEQPASAKTGASPGTAKRSTPTATPSPARPAQPSGHPAPAPQTHAGQSATAAAASPPEGTAPEDRSHEDVATLIKECQEAGMTNTAIGKVMKQAIPDKNLNAYDQAERNLAYSRLTDALNEHKARAA